ncbi:MAG: hypothetical protein Q9219_004093 [cf. Caloplaca sp. 3 TL-2023]
MSSETVLFDIPSRDPCTAWSPNTLKTEAANTSLPPSTARLTLNYKKIPYTTHWLEYPSIAPYLTSLSVPPNPPTAYAPYTLPAILIPGQQQPIMESRAIALVLEEKYPTPALHPNDPRAKKLEELFTKVLVTGRGIFMPLAPRTLLSPGSLEYFHDTRSRRFGMSLDQLEKEEGGEETWEKVKALVLQISEVVKEGGSGADGPFVRGKEMSYADFVLFGGLYFFRRLDERVFERVVGMDAALEGLYRAVLEKGVLDKLD